MSKNFRRYFISSTRYFLIALLALALVGCGGQGSTGYNSTSPSAGAQAAAPETLTISIGGCGYPTPYQWLDDNGQLQGYDIAVAEEVARRSGFNLRWENTEFPALFLGLDANRYQVIVGNISYTDERAEKYLFPEEYYCRLGVNIILSKGQNSEIKSIDDLAGRRVPIFANGSTNAEYFLRYNEEHPDAPIDLVFMEDSGSNLTGLASGLYDAVMGTMISVQQVTEETGLEFDVVTLPEEVSEAIMPAKAYYVFTKDSVELAEKFDAAMKDMIADGTLKNLSLEYFGVDLSR
ncbi:MAG: transporter substrate-binding domain-containing protein [Peptococcaceae bacterium]|jgi:ABC-type amino acid transport substrate-binding protein|nr:transporter substrate-binding domain-containing protein [Peptococcaceae bacterium]